MPTPVARSRTSMAQCHDCGWNIPASDAKQQRVVTAAARRHARAAGSRVAVVVQTIIVYNPDARG